MQRAVCKLLCSYRVTGSHVALESALTVNVKAVKSGQVTVLRQKFGSDRVRVWAAYQSCHIKDTGVPGIA